MQINVAFRHIDPSDNLRDYVEDKISRVKKYLDEPIEANVVLKVEKFRHSAEVFVDANGLRINGIEVTDDMYSAIDLVADKIEGQIRRSKDKSRRNRHPSAAKTMAPGEFPAEEKGAPMEPRIIETEQLFAKPMDIDEAVMQLDISNSEFMLFTNRHSNRINVLYRRKDGHLGLIEAMQ